MKSLILAACVGSTVAVVAPQFPPPAVSFADAGMGMDVRPFSLCSEVPTTVQQGPPGYPPGYSLIRFQLGSVPADFVVTDFVVTGINTQIYVAKVRVGGVLVTAFDPRLQTLELQHGLPIPAGSLVEVEFDASTYYSTTWPVRVTLAGYIR